MGKHLLDETAEFTLPRVARHAAADEGELEQTQRFNSGLRPQRPAPTARQDPEADAR
ncbi:hypothetical protein ACI8AC_06245 [Geodermatophilus sp. SYSU D00758]